MKNMAILFLCLFAAMSLSAQQLSGKIVNAQNNRPIPLVNVYLPGSNIGTATDEKGNFELRGDFNSGDIIRFSHISFETVEISISAFNLLPGKKLVLNPKVIPSQTILVKGSIGEAGTTPISFSKIDRAEIEQAYTNQDIPELLSYLPSVTFYSENGNGLGYNYISIRGFDQRRISVSINGIPQNDPEDHNVYWLDFPDLIESTELIQVQRGAGSGIIGYPAIGGAINIITSAFSDKPRMEFSSSIGNYNTRKYSAVYSSGLIGNRYSIYAKLSQTLSSGYRNSSWIDFKSYHLSAARYDENLTTQINLFGGPVADGLAYTGLPKFAVKDEKLRKLNYSYWEADGNNFTFALERRPDEIENFSQPHFELLNELRLSKSVIFNSALFLVLGNGFFDYDGSWADTSYFRLTRENGFRPTGNPGNVLIRAMVENRQWGWIPRLSIEHTNGKLIVGGEIRFHNSVHWGSLNYGENLPAGLRKDFRYYYYEGGKDILSFYVHENYNLSNQINLLAELQLAYHKYKIANERYLDNEFEIDDLFVNPRVGLNYKLNENVNFYVTYANVTREPRLKNYYDAAESSGGAVPQFEQKANGEYDFSKPLVKPETMNNVELGAAYSSENTAAGLNLFYMIFNDEIVKKGQLDRFGQPVTGNMDRTIHYGVEATFNHKISDNLELVLNGSVGKNYISSGYAFAEVYDSSIDDEVIRQVDLTGNRISGFPDLNLNAIARINYENLFVQLNAKYVGKFYTDNYDSKLKKYLSLYPGIADYDNNVVDPYFVVNLYTAYEFSAEPVFKNLRLFLQINNLFDNLYASYGIGKEFFPAAERNLLVGLKVGL